MTKQTSGISLVAQREIEGVTPDERRNVARPVKIGGAQ